LFEKFFSQIAKNIKKKDFIFYFKSLPKAFLSRRFGEVILPRPRQSDHKPSRRRFHACVKCFIHGADSSTEGLNHGGNLFL
jgi:hypothetical protein